MYSSIHCICSNRIHAWEDCKVLYSKDKYIRISPHELCEFLLLTIYIPIIYRLITEVYTLTWVRYNCYKERDTTITFSQGRATGTHGKTVSTLEKTLSTLEFSIGTLEISVSRTVKPWCGSSMQWLSVGAIIPNSRCTNTLFHPTRPYFHDISKIPAHYSWQLIFRLQIIVFCIIFFISLCFQSNKITIFAPS